MQEFYGCKLATFGSKPTGFVLEETYNEENETVFVIKQYLQKEVEEHLEFEEKEYLRLNAEETKGFNLEELIQFAKQELNNKAGKDVELFVHAAVVDDLCAKI